MTCFLIFFIFAITLLDPTCSTELCHGDNCEDAISMSNVDDMMSKLNKHLKSYIQQEVEKAVDDLLDNVNEIMDNRKEEINKYKIIQQEAEYYPCVVFTATTSFGGPLVNFPMRYERTLTNIGNFAYNTATGIFTVPVSGLYAISFSMMGSSNNTLYEHLYINDTLGIPLYNAGHRREITSNTVYYQSSMGDRDTRYRKHDNLC